MIHSDDKESDDTIIDELALGRQSIKDSRDIIFNEMVDRLRADVIEPHIKDILGIIK